MLYVVIGISLLVRASEGLLCLKCNDVAQPRHCTTVVECPHSDVCYVDRSVNDIGETSYILGCSPANICTNITSTSQSSRCTNCCGSNLCNHQACGEPDYPSDRGLICYSCHDPVPAGRCHNIEFCRSGEECSVTGNQLFGTMVFTSKCQKAFFENKFRQIVYCLGDRARQYSKYML
ncbi:uncharacterized protein LOC128221382 [Mya arenaria]|uniref:uncharacterized protein LOC128221382 n=1 Tax=Mya arenaria TaxID=6604 RepID=UPI0022E5B185|nr:uncharacterized protein LOC128221382 [Mya arenaria]